MSYTETHREGTAFLSGMRTCAKMLLKSQSADAE
jgi:hypothetical protein